MFRLTVFLLLGIGAAMLIGGRDLTPEELAELGIEPEVETTRAATDTASLLAPVQPAAAAPAVYVPPAAVQPVVQSQPEPQVSETAVQDAVALAMETDLLEEPPLGAEPEPQIEAPSLEQEIAAALTDSQVWYVNAERVNVRQGPSTDFAVVDQVVFGEATEILSNPDDSWVKIRIQGDGVEGYIARRFLQDSEPSG